MNVILEGSDGSGKSTLARRLSEELDVHLQLGDGPPKRPGEIESRMQRYLGMTDTIFDRHPGVSQVIYGQLRSETMSPAMSSLVIELYHRPNLFIYCRATNASRHVVKEGEDPAHVETLTQRYAELVRLYDEWALGAANLIYRIGDDVSRVVELVRVARRL